MALSQNLKKFYVSMGGWKYIALAPDEKEAICSMILAAGYKDSTDIPARRLPWVCFIVDERGHRKFDTYDMESIEVETGEALDYFDDNYLEYDPFCEREDVEPYHYHDDKMTDNYFEKLEEDDE